MMPMRMRRKWRKIEKVENLYRTATAQKILPTRRNKSDHACATLGDAKFTRARSFIRVRSVVAREMIKARDARYHEASGMPIIP
jgi:hypothetical protein